MISTKKGGTGVSPFIRLSYLDTGCLVDKVHLEFHSVVNRSILQSYAIEVKKTVPAHMELSLFSDTSYQCFCCQAVLTVG